MYSASAEIHADHPPIETWNQSCISSLIMSQIGLNNNAIKYFAHSDPGYPVCLIWNWLLLVFLFYFILSFISSDII